MFDVATTLLLPLPFTDAWVHEEWHRAVLGRRGIDSFDDVYRFRVTDAIAVSHVRDEDLIRLKRAAGRPKDLIDIESLEVGDEVDVLKFPIPLIHGGDGGRYVGTWHTVITKDPDSSWVNWGMYRLMVHDRNTLGCLFPMQQHIGQNQVRENRPWLEAQRFRAAVVGLDNHAADDVGGHQVRRELDA